MSVNSKKKNGTDEQSLRILFADDEIHLQNLIRNDLVRRGHSVAVCPDGPTALAALERDSFDCLIVDLDMPGMTGIEVIERMQDIQPDVDAVVMTGKPTRDSAIAAVHHQVFDYLTKPTPLAEIARMLQRIAKHRELKRQLSALENRLARAEGSNQLIGDGKAMSIVKRLIDKVGPTDSTVLIRGETGCGKELVAKALHQASLRSGKPLVAINCGALPESLIESELFGHCKGSFTGADTARTGLFEVANGGTIFLDEIGELPLSMQAKLLRVLETGDIRRLGDNQTLNVDVRVLCATHRDLEQMVEEGQFREDLMFRINTFEILVPPLRERPEDLSTLAFHLLKRHRNDATESHSFSDATIEQLQTHQWPGNVRELANVIEHASILCDDLPILPEHLPQHFGKRQLRKEIRESGPMSLKQLETIAIERALERHEGDKKAAADELGVSLKTLYNRLNAGDEKKAA